MLKYMAEVMSQEFRYPVAQDATECDEDFIRDMFDIAACQ